MERTSAACCPEIASAGAALDWLRSAAWPLWLEKGVDWKRRGFNESLDLDTVRSPAEFRRLRVVSRQVYVFAQASRFGLKQADAAVELGVAFLRERARQSDGGYAQRFDLNGSVIDGRRDLYDHAFVLLALSSAAAVLPQDPLRRESLDLLAYLDGRLRHPSLGYLESLPPALPRRQNPHMHLLEAFLGAHAAFGEPVFLDRAREMIELFLDRFSHPADGTLFEFLDDSLAPLREDGHYTVEPGHHCEWIWLMTWFRRQGGEVAAPFGPRLDRSATLLQAFVDRHGVNPATGTLLDEVWQNGAVKSPGSRLWPQTERLKSEALRGGAAMSSVYTALDRYLTPVPRGLWFERLQPDGTPSLEPAPASSLYHLTAGILFADAELKGG